MEGVYFEAKNGREPFPNVKRLTDDNISSLTTVDRVLLVLRSLQDEKAINTGKILRSKGVPFIVFASKTNKDEHPLEDMAHAFIDLHMNQGLVPTAAGERTGYPHLLCALYAYHNLKLTMEEILAEYES